MRDRATISRTCRAFYRLFLDASLFRELTISHHHGTSPIVFKMFLTHRRPPIADLRLVECAL